MLDLSQGLVDKPQMVLSDNIKGASLMAASMAAFIVNDTLMKLAYDFVSMYQAMLLRGLAATAMIVVIAAWRRELKVSVPKRERGILALRVLGEVGSTTAFLTALLHMPLANLTAIMQTMPLAVTLAAAVFLKEPLGWRRWSAIAVGFCGVLMIVRPGSDGFNSFSILALVAVAFVVLRDISTRRLNAQIPSIFVSLLTSVAVTVLAAVMAPTMEWRPLSGHALALLGTAAVCVIFGYIFSVKAMRVGEIAFVAPFRYTIMIWAILLGIFVFNDYPSQWTLIGAAIIVGTGVYSFYRERKRRLLAAKVAPRNP
ncbi:DMT family transporter [Hwanghaeella sp. 1Z406]|uniref:DMT family transporter n=1 Tax=Hwanghaeella sp. 1Z406 TaxID=3402811 RepID=UPI003B66F18E